MSEPLDDLMAAILGEMNNAISHDTTIVALYLVVLALGKEGKLVVPGAQSLYPLINFRCGIMIQTIDGDLHLTIKERPADVPVN